MARRRAKKNSSVHDIVLRHGIGTTVRRDLPDMAEDGTPCGNPIDGMAYFIVVSIKRKQINRFITWQEVINAWRKARGFSAKPSIEAYRAFFEDTYAPRLQAQGARVFAQVEGAARRRAGRVREGSKAKRAQSKRKVDQREKGIITGIDKGRKRAPRTLPERLETVLLESLMPVGPRSSWKQTRERSVPEASKTKGRAAGSRVDEAALEARREKKLAKARKDLAAKGITEQVLWQAGLTLEDYVDAGDEPTVDPTIRQPKGGAAAYEGMRGVNFQDAAGNFYRVTRKVQPTQQLKNFQPFLTRRFQAPKSGTLLNVLMAAARTGDLAPWGIDQKVARAFIRNAFVQVNGHIFIDPNTRVEADDKISIVTGDRAANPFFSWTKSWLPENEAVKCLTQEEAGDHRGNVEARSYTVYKTYNPVLYELTRLYWATGRGSDARFGSLLNHPGALTDLDAVGRYGTAVNLLQQAGLYAESPQNLSEMLYGALLSWENQPPPLFWLLWPLGQNFQEAHSTVRAFTQDPLGYVRKLKGQVSKAVPRLLKTRQIGTPKTRAPRKMRLTATSKQAECEKALAVVLGMPKLIGTKAEKVKLLKRLQESPPPVRRRGARGAFETRAVAGVPPTGEFDAPTRRLLNKLLASSPAPPGVDYPLRRLPGPGGEGGKFKRATMKQAETMLTTLGGMISEIDAAIAQIDSALGS